MRTDLYKVTRKLTAQMVETAYRDAGFPMAAPEFGLVSWHRPDPRAILPLDAFHVSRSLARTLHRGGFSVTFNQDFTGVMRACAQRETTWISDDFLRVYGELAACGHAHSVEVWIGDRLAGGVYGVHVGGAFFAESMFHRVTDMSKVALHALVDRLRQRGFALLNVQYLTPHLKRLGGIEIPLADYRRRLHNALTLRCEFP